MVSSSHGPAAGGRRRASLSLLRVWKAGVLPCRPASGPGGARRRRLRARRKPAPLLLEARPGLPALLAAPGGAQGGQALLLRAPPAGRSERPRRAPGCLRVRPAAQQLLGKVGLLRTAEAAGTEQRAASVQRDRAAPGCASLSTRSALNLGDGILSKITLKSGVGTIVETGSNDGRFMALRGPVAQAPGEGARRIVGLRLNTEARLRGAAACGAAGRAAA